jgi:dephospho-CoA kinase
MKIKSIISISGRISSGKSYAAEMIQNKFGYPVASFGSYLKYYCEHKNLPTDRKTLQDIGEKFVETNPQQFLIDVLSHFIGNADKIILEGVRHKIIFEKIKNITENHLSIFIDADLQTRYDRYYKRNKDSDEVKTFEQFMISDNHSVELEIEELKPLSQIVIDSTKEYSDELFEFLSSHQ